LAFANFRDPSETTAALAALNGYELQGRRLRVEYKRVLRHGEKEKIEREKALKRMRSAVGLNSSSSSYSSTTPVPPLPLAALPRPLDLNDTSPSVWNAPSSSSSFPITPQPPPTQQNASISVGSPGSSDLDSGSTLDKTAELDMNDSQTLESKGHPSFERIAF